MGRSPSTKGPRDSQRVKEIDDSHEPFDRRRALELAFKWGDEIPIGVIYCSRRESFESKLPVLQQGSLVEQFQRA